MPPRWTRQLGFFAALALGTLVFVSVAKPDACADVWTLEHHVSGCCRLSAETRLSGPGGDCCDYGAFEDRDPSATSVPLAVAPSPWVRVTPGLDRVDEGRPQWLARSRSIPERPPDRIRATTVLLI